jgi:hypothetical protein
MNPLTLSSSPGDTQKDPQNKHPMRVNKCNEYNLYKTFVTINKRSKVARKWQQENQNQMRTQQIRKTKIVLITESATC